MGSQNEGYRDDDGSGVAGSALRTQSTDWRMAQMLVRRRWLLIGSMVVAIATSVQYLRVVTPTFAATARLHLEQQKAGPSASMASLLMQGDGAAAADNPAAKRE